MFLASGISIKEEIRSLLSNDVLEPRWIAVAYWGAGSFDLLPPHSCKILCSLSSGGTNPAEIRKIRDSQRHKIKQLDGLHAKVVYSSQGAVVSSANFSTNGLGFERALESGTKEAGFRIAPSTPDHKAIEAWFLTRWTEGREIEEADLQKAENQWKQRKAAQLALLPEVDESVLLQLDIKPRHRIRSVTEFVLTVAQQTLPDEDNRTLGKVASWAVHLILARSKTPANYTRTNTQSEICVADEAWLVPRIRQQLGQKGIELTEVLIRSFAFHSAFNPTIRHWAHDLIENPPDYLALSRSFGSAK